MSCDDSTGTQKALSCVIAIIDSDSRPKGLEERTTSVRMRTLPTMDDMDENESSQEGRVFDQEQIVFAMQPDINLCRSINHTDTPIKITWLVETNSQVNTVNFAHTQNNADKPYIDCVTAIIKDFSYPQPTQATWLSNQF